METQFRLLVNSTDSYSDCWPPFFTLMAAYWPGYQETIYLNTETKEFAYPGIAIQPSHSQEAARGRRPTWSECFLHTLAQVPTDIVLYVQEDYFLKAQVDHAALNDLANTMLERDITYLSIVDFGNKGPFTPSGFDERLWTVGQKDPYRISLQACMINKKKFASYVRKHENPWQFEYYGNIRAHRRTDNFYAINRDMYGGDKAILPYDATGIVSKQWKQDVVEDLFAQHKIAMDYGIRGWHVRGSGPAPKRTITIPKIISTIRSLV